MKGQCQDNAWNWPVSVNVSFSFVLLYCWFVQKKETGQALLDKVFKYLELHERDYFGLQFASVVPNISDAVVSTHLFN